MFYGECYKCGERWELGTASTCKCEVGMTFDASAPVTITSHPYFYKRPWVGLTEQDIHDAFQFTELVKQLDFHRDRQEWCEAFAAYIEAKLKGKNQ